LSPDLIEAIEVAGHVLPFKTNHFLVKELTDWKKVPHDTLITLAFPQKGLLLPHHYEKMKATLSGFKKI
jgi:hypothetical protein